MSWFHKTGRWKHNKQQAGQSQCPVCFESQHCPTACKMPGEHGFCIITKASRDALTADHKAKVTKLEAEISRLEANVKLALAQAVPAGGPPGDSVAGAGAKAGNVGGGVVVAPDAFDVWSESV